MDRDIQVSFNSDQQVVTDVVKQSIAWLNTHDVEADLAANAEIVLAEALNNIVEHAFEFQPTGQIDLSAELSELNLTFMLKDNGKVFPGIPQKKEMKGAEIAFEDLPEGGFGWFLIHELTEQIAYARLEDQNALQLQLARG